GARAAVIAADEKTIAYLANRALGPDAGQLAALTASRGELRSDADAEFAVEHHFDANAVEPMVSWGTSPDQAAPITGRVPLPADIPAGQRPNAERAMRYMDMRPGQPLAGTAIDMAFIGSCTNGRIEDLRAAAAVAAGRHVAKHVRAIIVPGAQSVRRQAEDEGLDRVFVEAGFEWRPASGCSFCLAMNDDVADAGTRIASSTNRCFEGRQGRGARTHIMSPAMVAAAAVCGHLADVREHAGRNPLGDA
ncbi:3-isopropylmalate dehydratase large subunit, partial [bacterium]|nr:3-isopropylmalate dehydratase large subunit [bacterium]